MYMCVSAFGLEGILNNYVSILIFRVSFSSEQANRDRLLRTMYTLKRFRQSNRLINAL
jgi:hypothetical protein